MPLVARFCQHIPDFSLRREAHAHSSVLSSGWGPLSLTSSRRLSSCYRQQGVSFHCRADWSRTFAAAFDLAGCEAGCIRVGMWQLRQSQPAKQIVQRAWCCRQLGQPVLHNAGAGCAHAHVWELPDWQKCPPGTQAGVSHHNGDPWQATRIAKAAKRSS